MTGLPGRSRLVGLGQRLAGDDGVGLAVIEWLRSRGAAPAADLFEVQDATTLLPLLETPLPVVVVDAVVGPGRAGEVIELGEAEIPGAPVRPLSTHGVDVAGAIALARLLFAEGASPRIRLVGVRIDAPERGACTMSPAVVAAIPAAARAALRERGPA